MVALYLGADFILDCFGCVREDFVFPPTLFCRKKVYVFCKEFYISLIFSGSPNFAFAFL